MGELFICKDCMFWVQVPGKNKGECRKLPPSLGPNGFGYWPLIVDTEFCYSGEPIHQIKKEVLCESGTMADTNRNDD